MFDRQEALRLRHNCIGVSGTGKDAIGRGTGEWLVENVARATRSSYFCRLVIRTPMLPGYGRVTTQKD
jgi:hypothetical protein